IVAGDITEKLASHRSLSSAVSDVSLTTAVPSRDDLSPPEGTFSQVALGFQWLTDQNARLLAFFAPGGGLDCLANPIKLSMSPQRAKLLLENRDSVNRLVYGAQALLDGYGAYLRLADNNIEPEVQTLLDELRLLINRFKTLKQTIGSELERINHPLQAGKEGQVSFREWLATCHQLQFSLQVLNPKEAEQVRSVHELIFALHQRFVNALAPIALASGQGKVSKNRSITYVDYTNPSEDLPLLKSSDKVYIEKTTRYSAIVVIMDNAVIVNLKLGTHVGLVELLEHAEGGKGRTLRLNFSDQFESESNHKSGKLKRIWFLIQLLKAIELDKNADTMKISFNAVVGKMTVECSQMRSRESMQGAFSKLIVVLAGMRDLDMTFGKIAIFEGDQWDFNILAQRLNSDVKTEADRFAFQHALFSISYVGNEFIFPSFYRLLSNHHQQLIEYCDQLANCRCLISLERRSEDDFRKIFMNDEISDDTRREILPHLLLFDPERATRLYEDVYPHLRDKYFVINPSHNYELNFIIPPDEPLWDQEEKVKKALLEHGLKYASKRVRNDHPDL
ncbi:hypothetical protein, partial [Endozoicomonas sp. ONNA1]